jgi:hypothetical protein
MVSTGPISLGGTATTGGLNQSVNVELGRSGTATINMNESAVRGLAGVASGAISISNFYGKSSAFAATISSSQQELNLRTWALANGWNGSSAAQITVGSGVYIWSDNTSVAGLTIDGSWPGGITLINNGFIMGKGGTGSGYSGGSRPAGGNGGPAITLGTNCIITNNSYIAGGGGGGGCAYGQTNTNTAGGGGGAGGGAGGGGFSANVFYPGDAGGTVGNYGSPFNSTTTLNTKGASGGRIVPGTSTPLVLRGTAGAMQFSGQNKTGAGGGGAILAAGQPSTGKQGYPAVGGFAGNNGDQATGLGLGAAGYICCGGGGGGYGASGGSGNGLNFIAVGAGSGGKSVNLNGYSVTWNATGTRYGTIS